MSDFNQTLGQCPRCHNSIATCNCRANSSRASACSAFPVDEDWHDGINQGTRRLGGITIRDYFAARAMIRLIENTTKGEGGYLRDFQGDEEEHDKWVADRSYEIADAMLVSRQNAKADPAREKTS